MSDSGALYIYTVIKASFVLVSYLYLTKPERLLLSHNHTDFQLDLNATRTSYELY